MNVDSCTGFSVPPTGQSVTRFDSCPCFAERKSLLAIESICWFCKYAEFDLLSDKLPEQGVCRCPEVYEPGAGKHTNEAGYRR